MSQHTTTASKVLQFRPRQQNGQAKADEAFDPNRVILEITITPRAGLCMKTVNQRRTLTQAEAAVVAQNLRTLQQMLLDQHAQLTSGGSESRTDGPTAR